MKGSYDLQIDIDNLEKKYQRMVKALKAIRNAGPAFPAWSIATDVLRELGEIPPKWEPTEKKGKKR